MAIQDARRSSRPSSEVDHVNLSVVLPVYNEADNVPLLTEEILEVLSSERCADYAPFEIILVDDGSTDGSRQQLRDFAERHDHVQSILLQHNFGQSAALSAGIDSAHGDVIVTMDSDRQNDPHDIPDLLEKFEEGYHCVSGWRADRRDPLSKKIPSAVQTHLAKLTGPNIHDFGCTLKMYDAECVRDVDLYGEGHRYIPAKLHNKGYSITEIEVNHREREHGSSKYGTNRLMKGSLDLLFHLFWNRFSTRPLHLFGTVGALLLGAGGLLGTHMLFSRFVLGNALTPHLPRLMLVVALVLFGLQVLIFGVLAEMLTRLYYQDRTPYRIQTVIE